jgi:putative sigma-54 modulation protein
MRIELTGRQIDITAGVRRIIDAKLAKLERVLNDSAVSAQVVVSREKIGHRADVTLHARGERFLHGNGHGENLGAAVAEAVDKLVQQARKVKGKYEGRKRQSVKTLPETLDGSRVCSRLSARRSGPARSPRRRRWSAAVAPP